jgi:hypothetical protein
VRIGDPAFEIQIRGVTRPKLRCATCAGEPVQAVDIADPRRASPSASLRTECMARLGRLAEDWKLRQSGGE